MHVCLFGVSLELRTKEACELVVVDKVVGMLDRALDQKRRPGRTRKDPKLPLMPAPGMHHSPWSKKMSIFRIVRK